STGRRTCRARTPSSRPARCRRPRTGCRSPWRRASSFPDNVTAMEELLAPAEALIGIRSTADRPGELHRALGLVLDVVGPGFDVRRFESRGKPSALVTHPDRP